MHTLQQLRSGALAGLQRVSLRCGTLFNAPPPTQGGNPTQTLWEAT